MAKTNVVRQAKSVQSFDNKTIAKQAPPKDLPKATRVAQEGLSKPLDPLSHQLDQKSYIYKARFGWLKQEVCGKKYALDIERFYEPLKLCIDIKHGDREVENTKLKKELCEQNGMKYFYLTKGEDVEVMLQQVGVA